MAFIYYRQDGSRYAQWCFCMVFLTLICGVVAGDKFMFPHTIEWTILVMVYASLRREMRTATEPRVGVGML
jgi:hypothetical protein